MVHSLLTASLTAPWTSPSSTFADTRAARLKLSFIFILDYFLIATVGCEWQLILGWFQQIVVDLRCQTATVTFVTTLSNTETNVAYAKGNDCCNKLTLSGSASMRLSTSVNLAAACSRDAFGIYLSTRPLTLTTLSTNAWLSNWRLDSSCCASHNLLMSPSEFRLVAMSNLPVKLVGSQTLHKDCPGRGYVLYQQKLSSR